MSTIKRASSWAPVAPFAEVAETLAIEPEQIAAVIAKDGRYVVLFTQHDEPAGPIWGARLGRHADGVLAIELVVETRETMAGSYPRLVALVEAQLAEAEL